MYKSREALIREIKTFVNNIDQTIAMIERVRPIIQNVVE